MKTAEKSHLILFIVPHIPKALGICEKKFQRFSLKNLWAKNEKSSWKQLNCDFFHYFFYQEWPWDRAGRFAYHKPYELNKMGDKFFIDFSFFTHRFFKENLWNFFSQMPDALGICGTIYKVKKEKNLFRGEIWLPSQNARTRVTLLYYCTNGGGSKNH